MTPNDVASFAGLTAMVLLTVNLLLGLLVSTNYNPARDWPRRKLPVPLWRIHNWTAYVALAAIFLHATALQFVPSPRFGLFDVLLPLSSPGQRLYNNLGACAFWGFLFVVVTSYFRPQLRHRPWKKLHYTAYAAAAFLYAHGTLIDPNLKGNPPDFFDGEKVLVEGCGLLVIAGIVWRIRRGTERQRRESTVTRTLKTGYLPDRR